MLPGMLPGMLSDKLPGMFSSCPDSCPPSVAAYPPPYNPMVSPLLPSWCLQTLLLQSQANLLHQLQLQAAHSGIIKNVSSSTSHKKTPSLRPYVFPSFRPYVFPSVQEFKKILPNTFIYESILIKIYMNTNINPTLPLMISSHYVSSSQPVSL
jgi:hypothetical protein